MTLKGLGICNYRSFDAEGVCLDDLGKINILIGKNNSGKSNVLRFLRRFSSATWSDAGLSFDAVRDSFRRSATSPHAYVRWSPLEYVNRPEWKEEIVACGLGEVCTHVPIGRPERKPSTTLSNLNFHMLIDIWRTTHPGRRYDFWPPSTQLADEIDAQISAEAYQVLLNWGERLVYVPDFRRIAGGDANDAAACMLSGQNIIAQLHEFQHPTEGDDGKRRTFQKINEMVRQLLNLNELSIEVDHSKTAILMNMHGNRLSLESFGTGVHQLVLFCVGFALHENKVICIEEPELHLHPELQRRFLRFIEQTSNTYFITTHSSVFLDFSPNVRVYHVEHDGNRSTIRRVETNSKARDVLDDLGYKASDLLQSNAVIWVEGPSDRIYINKWISLLDPELVERLHYSVMFYGGASLSHVTCEGDFPADEFVSLLHINRNAFVVMDRDGTCGKAKMTRAKKRVKSEIGEDCCWMTKGREIENYLRGETIAAYIGKKYGKPGVCMIDPDEPVDKAIKRSVKAAGISRCFTYSDAKAEHAREITKAMTTADLDVLDLHRRIKRLASTIREWNHLPALGAG